MSQGMKRRMIPDKALQEATKKGWTDYVVDAGKFAFDKVADVAQDYQNWVDKNQIEYNKKQENNWLNKLLPSQVQKDRKDTEVRQQNIQKRESEGAQRNRDLNDIKLQDKGLATPIREKSRIINNVAAQEVKSLKPVPADLDSQLNEALTGYEKQLKEYGYSSQEVAQYLGEARKKNETIKAEALRNEAQSSKAAIADLTSGSLDGVNKLKLTRSFNKLDEIQGKGDKTLENAGLLAAEVGTRIVAQPLAKLGGELSSLGAGAVDLATGNKFNLGQKVGEQTKQFNQAFDNALGNEENLGNAAQSFVGNALPYMFMPETKLARGFAAEAARSLAPGLGRKLVQSGVKEVMQDAPLSIASTLGDLTGQVQRGEITTQQALQNAPGALAGNALGDFVGAGAMRGAGDLIGKGIENLQTAKLPNLPKAKDASVGAVLERPKAEIQTNAVNPGRKALLESVLGIEKKQPKTIGSKSEIKSLEQDEKSVRLLLKTSQSELNNLRKAQIGLDSPEYQAALDDFVSNKTRLQRILDAKESIRTSTASKAELQKGIDYKKVQSDVQNVLEETPKRPQEYSPLSRTNPQDSLPSSSDIQPLASKVDISGTGLPRKSDDMPFQQSSAGQTNTKPLEQILEGRNGIRANQQTVGKTPLPESSQNFSKNPSQLQDNLGSAKSEIRQDGIIDPRSFAQSKEGLSGREFQDNRRNLQLKEEEGGYIPPANKALGLKEKEGRLVDEAARTEVRARTAEAQSTQIKDLLKQRMPEGETLLVKIPINETGYLKSLAGKEIPVKMIGSRMQVLNKEAAALMEKLRKAESEFKENNPDLFSRSTTEEAEDVLSIQPENLNTRLDFDYTKADLQTLGLNFLRKDIEANIARAESKVLRTEVSNKVLTSDRLRDLVSDSDRSVIFQRKKGATSIELKSGLEGEAKLKAEEFKELKKQIEDVKNNPDNLFEERNKSVRTQLSKEIKAVDNELNQILEVAKGTSKNKLVEGTEAGQKLIKSNIEKRAGGNLFAINPFGIALASKTVKELLGVMQSPVFIVDGLLGSIGLKRGWSEILPKLTKLTGAKADSKPGQILQQLGDLTDSMLGTQRFIREQFQLSKNPKVKEFIKEYEALNDRLAIAKSIIASEFSAKDVQTIRGLMSEYTPDELKVLIAKGSLEGVADSGLLDIINTLSKAQRKKVSLIRSYQKSFEGQDFNNLKALLALEAPSITNNPLIEGANGLAMKVALFNRASSTLLTLTDPILKNAVTGNINPLNILNGYFKAVASRKSKLFEAFQAGKSGTYLDEAKGLNINNVDVFKLGTEYAQDVTLFAQARKFEADWKKETGQSINIVDDFDPLSVEGSEFAMRWNKFTAMAFGNGEGQLDRMNIQSSSSMKGFLALQGESMRFQGMLNKAIRNKDYTSIIGFLGYGTLIGGTGFLTKAGAIGGLFKTGINQLPPEQREKALETIEQANLANRLLGLKIGEKLGLGTLKQRDEESIVKAIETAYKEDEEGKMFLIEVAKRFPKNLEKGIEEIQAGRPLDGALRIAKALPYVSGVASLGQAVQRTLNKDEGSLTPVWTKENGKLEAYFKSAEWQDALGTSTGAKNIQRASKLKDEIRDLIDSKRIEKEGKNYRIVGATDKEQKRLNELLDVVTEDKYQIPHAHYSKTEIMDSMMESIYKKRERQEKQKGKMASPFDPAYIKANSAEDLIRTYGSMRESSDREKAARLIEKELRGASPTTKKKLKTVRERVGI